MSWLDSVLSEDPKKICPLVPQGEKPFPHKGFNGDKRLVSDLSPTCPPMLTLACWDPTLEALCEQADSSEAQYLRQERAGILEYQGGFTRKEAERLSLACQ